jgi:hypothetical protein
VSPGAGQGAKLSEDKNEEVSELNQGPDVLVRRRTGQFRNDD